jgi:hypothetical protein
MRELSDLRVSMARLKTKLDSQEKSIKELSQKVDSFTWKILLWVLVIVAAQYILR